MNATNMLKIVTNVQVLLRLWMLTMKKSNKEMAWSTVPPTSKETSSAPRSRTDFQGRPSRQWLKTTSTMALMYTEEDDETVKRHSVYIII